MLWQLSLIAATVSFLFLGASDAASTVDIYFYNDREFALNFVCAGESSHSKVAHSIHQSQGL
jgi:hypothetical protein